MDILIYIVLILIPISQIYLICVMGRIGNPDLDKFLKFRYAHRGLHKKGSVPENSLTAFSDAAAKGYGIELDLHLMADGTLAVIHDSSLLRTTGKEGKIEDLTKDDLKKYFLEGTRSKIPTFSQVLKKVNGKVPLLIELKTKGNAKALCQAVANQLEGYKGDYLIQSFDPRCLVWFKKNKPEVLRGILTENFFKDSEVELSFPLKFVLGIMLLNIWAKPDFVANNFLHRNSLANKIALKYWKLKGFVWTIRKKEDLETAEKEGYTVIFEDTEP